MILCQGFSRHMRAIAEGADQQDRPPAMHAELLPDDAGGGFTSPGACDHVTPLLTPIAELLQSKAIAIGNDLRGALRNFGLKVRMVGKAKFEARIKGAGPRTRPRN